MLGVPTGQASPLSACFGLHSADSLPGKMSQCIHGGKDWMIRMQRDSNISRFGIMLYSLSLGLSVALGRRRTPPVGVWRYRWSGPAMLVPWELELLWAHNLQ